MNTRRRQPQQKREPHVSARLDQSMRDRSEAVRKRLSDKRREATDSDTYRMLMLVGAAAVEALEREGWSLRDATLVGPPPKGLGAHKTYVAVQLGTSTKSRIEEVRRKLSVEWREATRSDAIRLLLLLGLRHVEAVPGKNLERKVPELLASLAARARGG